MFFVGDQKINKFTTLSIILKKLYYMKANLIKQTPRHLNSHCISITYSKSFILVPLKQANPMLHVIITIPAYYNLFQQVSHPRDYQVSDLLGDIRCFRS